MACDPGYELCSKGCGGCVPVGHGPHDDCGGRSQPIKDEDDEKEKEDD